LRFGYATFAGSQKLPAFEVDGCVPSLKQRGLPLKDRWLIKGIRLTCSGFEGARDLYVSVCEFALDNSRITFRTVGR
jgi:hypothetical protein